MTVIYTPSLAVNIAMALLTPIPDPTVLTTAQLRREVSALRDTLETRLDAMDRATVLLQAQIPLDIARQAQHLKELHDERFLSIEKLFSERANLRKASELAMAAALQAQKDAATAQNVANAAAITKSEAATVKQIDGILALIGSGTKAVDEKISSINGRLDRGEGKDTGTASSVVIIFAVIGALVGIGGIALNLIGHNPTVPITAVVAPH